MINLLVRSQVRRAMVFLLSVCLPELDGSIKQDFFQ
jgi:hypothetical protein